ncbi:MAG: MATE family efflux transporter [Lachnospiraceae bacterium]|nr:MATE family efflux transporter [Lachnospiraceae bacterium]
MAEKENLYNKMLRLVLPISFQQLMLALVGASDAIMLGKLDQNAMSAVSLASQVTFVFNLFMTAFVVGENMFAAQYYGKKDYAGISATFVLVLRISCLMAIPFLTGSLFFPDRIMCFLTNEPDLIRMGNEYLRYIGISYLFSAIAQVCLTILKNCGAVNQSSVISSLTVMFNIVLNAVFIFGLWGFPAMGIRGAALATVTATALQMILGVVYVKREMRQIKVHLLEKDRELAKQFRLKVAPVMFNELIWGCGFTLYSIIMGHLGTDAVAANSIANISKNLMICFCLGLGSGGSILIGNELGADHFEEAKRIGRILTWASVIGGVLSGLFLLALSPAIISLVDLTPEAKNILGRMLVICSYYIAGKSINCMTIGGIFPAGGDSKFGLVCDTVTLWCITIPLGCLCAFVYRLPVLVVYFVLNLDEVIKLPAVYRHYKKYGWVKNITNQSITS